MGTPARLVRFDPDERRPSDLQWTHGIQTFNQFSDGFAALVLGQPSLDQFNQKLQARGTPGVSMARFRPNLVLGSAAGADALLPHDEDRVAALDIRTDAGAVQLRLVKPCPRCPSPNVDPATGLTSPAVGDMLQSFRADARLNGAVTFGMNAIVVAPEVDDADAPEPVLRVGQRVSGHYRLD